MATHTQHQQNDVTITLTADEFAAINSFLYDIRERDTTELSESFRDAGIYLGCNYLEVLTKMWGDLNG